MAHLFKMTEWESGAGGIWYCGDVEDLGNNSGAWWITARMLGMSLTDYVEMLINTFKVDKISYNRETNVLIYSSKNQDCRCKFCKIPFGFYPLCGTGCNDFTRFYGRI